MKSKLYQAEALPNLFANANRITWSFLDEEWNIVRLLIHFNVWCELSTEVSLSDFHLKIVHSKDRWFMFPKLFKKSSADDVYWFRFVDNNFDRQATDWSVQRYLLIVLISLFTLFWFLLRLMIMINKEARCWLLYRSWPLIKDELILNQDTSSLLVKRLTVHLSRWKLRWKPFSLSFLLNSLDVLERRNRWWEFSLA